MHPIPFPLISTLILQVWFNYGLATFAYSTGNIPRATSNTSKAGLAWPNGNTVDITQFQQTAKISWYYTWSPGSVKTNLEFVPMLWGPKSVGDFSSQINQSISENNVKAVLGMNEPQEAGQSNLTPEAGAEMWKTYLEPLRAQGVRLGSPAPSSAPSGKTWLQAFLTACAGNCTVDFIALHYYDINATQFVQYLQDFHNVFQRPLWITEWACQNFNNASRINFNGPECDPSDAASFLSQTQSFMDASDFVERYAWSGAMRGTGSDALLDTSGVLTSLGKQYIGA
ncbi:glycoside hydrolase [Infundibulicybe gibba]|nr:glycoside hydrolase [Infundibulicybe gibba]